MFRIHPTLPRRYPSHTFISTQDLICIDDKYCHTCFLQYSISIARFILMLFSIQHFCYSVSQFPHNTLSTILLSTPFIILYIFQTASCLASTFLLRLVMSFGIVIRHSVYHFRLPFARVKTPFTASFPNVGQDQCLGNRVFIYGYTSTTGELSLIVPFVYL